MPKGKKQLRDFLGEKLLKQFDYVSSNAAATCQEFQKGDNKQGPDHCKAVERNLDLLIPDAKKETGLNDTEIFVLLAAAHLHDIGKVEGSDRFGWKSDHGRRGQEIINEHYESLALDSFQAAAVGYIVGVHGDGRLDQLPSNPMVIGTDEVHLIELAAVFRLADMLDTTHERTPEVMARILFPNGNVPDKWKARQAISGWTLDKDDRIVLQGNPTVDEVGVVFALKGMMNDDLANIATYLRMGGYPWELAELDIGEARLSLSLKQQADRDRPFPGMAYYEENQAGIFKGRDKETGRLISVVWNSPITLLIGESGAGKTSLIHAGLFPLLRSMKWECVWTRPLDDPPVAMRNQIWQATLEGRVDSKCSLWQVMKLAAEKCRPRNLLIAIDQFEDVLSAPQPVLDELVKDFVTVQARSVIPNLRVLVSFREDSFVRLSTRLLKAITGSAQQFPSVELERLSREAAKQAFLAGLENARIGLDPRQEAGEKPLIEIILDDIQRSDDRLYPPYLQMVAETLCAMAEKDNPIISREMYDSTGGANDIIAHYLIRRLEEFGPQKDQARKVLIFLTSSVGRKAHKTLPELCQTTEIEADELKGILGKLIDLRMARTIDDEYEIIHDHLGLLVDSELVGKEDRELKFLQEQLDAAQRLYEVHREPIRSTTVWASLYRNRRRVLIGEDKQSLLLCSFCWNVARPSRPARGLAYARGRREGEVQRCGWFWLRDLSHTRLLALSADLIKHDDRMISEPAAELLVSLAIRDRLPLITCMLKEEDSRVRRAEAEAFAKVGTRDDLPIINDMLRDEDFDVSRAAVGAFVNVGTRDELPLINRMLNDANRYLRRAAAEAFAKVGTRDDLPIIDDMLRDEDCEVRQAAVEVFGNFGTRDDLLLITHMLKDEDSEVRQAVVEVFAKVGSRQELPLITGSLNDVASDVRRAAVEVFGKVGIRDDLPFITGSLNDVDSDVRRAAVEVFGELGTRDDLPLIAGLLEDEEVGQAAAEAYGNVLIRDDFPLIIGRLKDEDPEVRQAVMEVFGKVGTRDDLPIITDVLKDEDSEVRQAAVKVLGAVATRDDLPIIADMLRDDDFAVRRTAVEVLGKVATRDDLSIITDMLKDRVTGVGQVAVEALIRVATDDDADDLLDLVAERAQGWDSIAETHYEALCRLDRKFYCPIPEEE